MARNQPVNHLESHIVASAPVFFSRIAKADDGEDLLFFPADINHNSVNSEQ
jgi:hypothetical protein